MTTESDDISLPGEPDAAGDGGPDGMTKEDRRRIMASDPIMRMYVASSPKPVDYFA